MLKTILLIMQASMLFCVAAEAQRIVQPVRQREVACKDYDVLLFMRSAIPKEARRDLYLSGECIDLEPGISVVDDTELKGFTVSRADRCLRPIKPKEYRDCYWTSVNALQRETPK